MGSIRKPFEGVKNIIFFNWHFYVIAFSIIISFMFLSNFTEKTVKLGLWILCLLLLIPILISLVISYYIYDLSRLYDFHWIKKDDRQLSVINISAGFDETSLIIKNKFKNCDFLALDFYNPQKHTEISIKRARRKFDSFPGTKSIKTLSIDLESNSIDKIFIILSAHEIRNKEERIVFFSELKRILRREGEMYVVEHLRDCPNFIAYTLGFFHFYSRKTWLSTFNNAKLNLVSEYKSTPFISIFKLNSNGDTF